MPEKQTIKRAQRDKREGKSPSVQAGEFVREEIHHIRQGRHGATSAKQAIAIGLSQARRAGVDLPPPGHGKTSERTRKSAERAYEVGQGERAPRAPSAKRSKAIKGVLEREERSAASHRALSKQARSAAKGRTPEQRSAAARQAAESKGPQERRAAARKAVRTKGEGGLLGAARKAVRTRAAG